MRWRTWLGVGAMLLGAAGCDPGPDQGNVQNSTSTMDVGMGPRGQSGVVGGADWGGSPASAAGQGAGAGAGAINGPGVTGGASGGGIGP